MYDKLRKLLPRGIYTDLAGKFEVTPETVRNVARGKSNRPDIMRELLRIAEQNNKLKERLKSL